MSSRGATRARVRGDRPPRRPASASSRRPRSSRASPRAAAPCRPFAFAASRAARRLLDLGRSARASAGRRTGRSRAPCGRGGAPCPRSRQLERLRVPPDAQLDPRAEPGRAAGSRGRTARCASCGRAPPRGCPSGRPSRRVPCVARSASSRSSSASSAPAARGFRSPAESGARSARRASAEARRAPRGGVRVGASWGIPGEQCEGGRAKGGLYPCGSGPTEGDEAAPLAGYSAHDDTARRPIRPSRRLAALEGYAFDEVKKRVAALRAQGIEPIDFGVGDPTVPTPQVVRERLKTAVDERATSGYPAYQGDPAYRAACAAWMERRFGVALDPEREICATIGSKEAVFHVARGLPRPGRPHPRSLARLPALQARRPLRRGASPGFYPLRRENGFLPDLDAIPDDVADRARAIWVCYPNSPTGRRRRPRLLRAPGREGATATAGSSSPTRPTPRSTSATSRPRP